MATAAEIGFLNDDRGAACSASEQDGATAAAVLERAIAHLAELGLEAPEAGVIVDHAASRVAAYAARSRGDEAPSRSSTGLEDRLLLGGAHAPRLIDRSRTAIPKPSAGGELLSVSP